MPNLINLNLCKKCMIKGGNSLRDSSSNSISKANWRIV